MFSLKRRVSRQPAPEPDTIGIGELGAAAEAFLRGDPTGWRGRFLALPSWFIHGLDPDGLPYREQMLRLWSAITGRAAYDSAEHEDTPEIAGLDPIAHPSFWCDQTPEIAGAHLMAIGHLIVRGGIERGARVLEYGAGLGEAAVAFARLGATVETVDINPAYCDAIRKRAAHHGVALTAHHGRFGDNPADADQAYDLIYFYESFHHCFDFADLIPRLRAMLKPGGRVLMGGEPIFAGPAPDMPYPWGFRLDWENVAVMRIRGWMELGFRQDFLFRRFAAAGMSARLHSDPNSHWAQVYEFRPGG